MRRVTYTTALSEKIHPDRISTRQTAHFHLESRASPVGPEPARALSMLPRRHVLLASSVALLSAPRTSAGSNPAFRPNLRLSA